jgi:hypothetical protein
MSCSYLFLIAGFAFVLGLVGEVALGADVPLPDAPPPVIPLPVVPEFSTHCPPCDARTLSHAAMDANVQLRALLPGLTWQKAPLA